MVEYSRFEHLLELKGVTATEVSKETGVSRSALTDWKKGRYIPKFDKLQKLADYFGIEVSYFDVQQNEHGDGYYINEKTARAAQEMFENKKLRVLFDAARDASPEDLEAAYNVLMALKAKEKYTDDTGC